MELRCLEEIEGNPDLKHTEAASRWTLSESGVSCEILERREATEDDEDDENDHYYKSTCRLTFGTGDRLSQVAFRWIGLSSVLVDGAILLI
jgi:hypothetical protein